MFVFVFKTRTSYWANSQVASCWWFETPLHSCDITVMFLIVTQWSKKCIRNLCPVWHHCNVSLLNMLKVILVTGDWGTPSEIALRWLPLGFTNDKSTLVRVMAWCHQATSHYLGQGWEYNCIIGICSYCVLDRPVFERCQTLLHPELRWYFLLADGAHHKKPHNPTHPRPTLTQIYVDIQHHWVTRS